MFIKSIPLPPFDDARIDVICLTDSKELNHLPRPAVIVFPGGGYGNLSDREAEPVAIRFLAAGYATFILRYSVKPFTKEGKTPLPEAALAIKHVRENAAEYNVDPNRVFVCGFSAGAHAAAALGVYWNVCPLLDVLPCPADRSIFRPTGMILSYPVITGSDFAHKNSVKRYFCTDEPTEEQINFFSLERHVTPDTCPAFIWHTVNDELVPIKNSLLFANALTEAGVPFEMHLYPSGAHGLSLADTETWSQKEKYNLPNVQSWFPLALEWAKNLK